VVRRFARGGKLFVEFAGEVKADILRKVILFAVLECAGSTALWYGVGLRLRHKSLWSKRLAKAVSALRFATAVHDAGAFAEAASVRFPYFAVLLRDRHHSITIGNNDTPMIPKTISSKCFLTKGRFPKK